MCAVLQLKRHNQANIVKKSVILFLLLNRTIGKSFVLLELRGYFKAFTISDISVIPFFATVIFGVVYFLSTGIINLWDG